MLLQLPPGTASSSEGDIIGEIKAMSISLNSRFDALEIKLNNLQSEIDWLKNNTVHLKENAKH